MPTLPLSRTWTTYAVLALSITALALSTACSAKKETKHTDFDTFIDRHRCEKLVKGGDGDIDMTCIDPQTGQRVAIEFEANDRPAQYFTDTNFGGAIQVFGQDEVRDSKIYPTIKKS